MSDGMKDGKLVLETKDGKDILGIRAAGKGSLPEGVKYGYEWTINGQPAGKEESVSGFKRGDKITVRITPVEGEKEGRPRLLETVIKNTTPRIMEVKSLTTETDRVSYQVIAADADKDVISFSLVDAPKGMKIDDKGFIDWRPSGENKEEATVTVKVADGHGGEALYPFKITTEKRPE